MIRIPRSLLGFIILMPGLLDAKLALAKGESIRRFAFIVGANDGGKGRAKLRYANQDAQSFVTVLNELGGVASADTVLVRDATRPAVNKALIVLKDRLQKSSANGERQEVVFYYSGHSDEDGLRLKSDVLQFKDLKQMITTLPVKVQIMVIDSCASGQLAMLKGGTRKPSFLLDSSTQTQGQAIITSSSSDEAAQESAIIGGSIFTHYLLSGLRGAADMNSDGKVTLNEAYQYAYAETLARTEKTMSGAQHPSYDFKLSGTGDIVLTDLRQSNAVLTIPSNKTGRYFIRQKNGDLVAEINKPAGRKVELGLAPGNYDVTVDQDKKLSQTSFILASNDRLDANKLDFSVVEGEKNPTRGKKEYRLQKATIGLLPPLENWNLATNDELHYFSFDLLGGHSGRLQGMTLGGFGHVVDEDADGVMLGMGVHWVRGDMTGTQLAHAGNFVKGSLTGAQFTVGVNWVNGDATGAQFSSGLNGVEGHLDGAQFGLVNIGRSTTGAQFGLVNITTSKVIGATFGLVNVNQEVTGAQLGLVNVTRSIKGVQLGLVNVSEDAEGAPIGLVSYVKDGRKDLDIYLDELGFAHVAFKMGSKNVYTIYDCGYRMKSPMRKVCGLGLGGAYQSGSYFAVIENLASMESTKSHKKDNDEDKDKKDGNSEDDWSESRPGKFLSRTQFLAGVEFMPSSWVYAGPSFAISNRGESEFDDVHPVFTAGKHTAEEWSSWFGLTVGTKYSF